MRGKPSHRLNPAKKARSWIDHVPGQIEFDVRLDRPLSEFDVFGVDELEWIEGSTVRFSVYDYDTSDEDDDRLNTTMPFQVAYAVSIHKAQGLSVSQLQNLVGVNRHIEVRLPINRSRLQSWFSACARSSLANVCCFVMRQDPAGSPSIVRSLSWDSTAMWLHHRRFRARQVIASRQIVVMPPSSRNTCVQVI